MDAKGSSFADVRIVGMPREGARPTKNMSALGLDNRFCFFFLLFMGTGR